MLAMRRDTRLISNCFVYIPLVALVLWCCGFVLTRVQLYAEALVVEMGGEPIWIAEGSRALYHAALAHGSNHLITLVTQTLDLLRSAGVEDPARLVAPLMSASLDNALRYGDQVLTGPVARGDAGTVAAHIRELGQISSSARAAYVALARVTADRALAAGVLRPESAEALLDVLSKTDEDLA